MIKYTLFLLLALATMSQMTSLNAQNFPNGNALLFSGGIGSGARVSFAGLSYNISSAPVTIEAWIYFTGGSSLQTIVNTSSDGGGGSGGYALFVNNWSTSDGNLALQTQSASISTTAGNVVPVNQWTHVAAVITSQTQAKLFVNGVEKLHIIH